MKELETLEYVYFLLHERAMGFKDKPEVMYNLAKVIHVNGGRFKMPECTQCEQFFKRLEGEGLMTSEKLERKLQVQRWRENHWKALEVVASSSATRVRPKTGLQLWRALSRIEKEASRDAVALCNGELDQEQYDARKEQTVTKVRKVFGFIPEGFFVNNDPRGYALKLDNEKVTIPEGMHKDWGGYGILAAVIDEE